MLATLADGVQIVPGYRLEKRLGKGGFGEVWRAIGPGKVPVALKIIEAKGSSTGEREFKSLDLLRDLRHPNLLAMQAYWLLDDDGQVIEDDRPPSTIVIAMLLGGKNLRQRLEECQSDGLAGIPPRELLGYLHDAAKGIDFLNKPIHPMGDRVVAIQHRDIKPENLMIVGGGVMVADFGIAGVMESNRSHTANAAMTFNYAAPELFDHVASAWTDQYALAISYCVLRTGELPFPAHSSPMQIIRVHTEGRHDYSKLSPGEQAVLRIATSKIPEQRFPTCQDMVAELDAAIRAAGLLDVLLPRAASATEPQLQGTCLMQGVTTDPQTQLLLPPGAVPSTSEKASSVSLMQTVLLPATSPIAPTDPMAVTVLGATALGTPTRVRPSRPTVAIATLAVLVVGGTSAWMWIGPGNTLTPKPANVTDVSPGNGTGTSKAPLDEPVVLPTNAPPPVVSKPAMVTPPTTPTPAELLRAAREQVAVAAKEKRFADVVKAFAPVFEQAAATSDDYVVRANAFVALADANESPAENYARAAADFAQAELPREQLRALTRQGRWLLDHNFPKKALAPLRQALALKKSPDLQFALCQALLADNEIRKAREEALAALAELPKDLSDNSDAASAARLHHLVGRVCLTLARQAEADPELAARVEPLDIETEQHFRDAVALGTSSKLDERAAWQDELSAFRKLPRVAAREERRLRKVRIAELTKAAEKLPDMAAKWLELADLEQRDGQVKLAAAHFGRGYSLQAIELARAGKFDDAATAEAKATEHDSETFLVHYARALIAVGQGRDRDAVTSLDTVLTRAPTKSNERWQYLSERASAYSRLAATKSGTQSDWEQARADFEAAIANFPQPVVPPENNAPATAAQQTMARLHHDRAAVLEALAGDQPKPDLAFMELAEKAWLAAVSLNPQEPRFALAAGRNLVRQARSAAPGSTELLDRATVLLTAATKLDDKQAEAHFALGDCLLLRGGQVAAAQAAFDKAVENSAREPTERQFQYSLNQSLAYLFAPRNDLKSLAAAERAVSLQRADPAGHFARARALRNLKRTNETIGAFDDTLSLQPKHVGALLGRSQLIIEHEKATAKQLDQAQQDIETALATAATDDQKAEAFYVRSLASLKTHVSNVTQSATAEPALLKAQRDLLQAVKLLPANAVYGQAATELFDYAAKFTWVDTQRKADSESLQRELKSIRRK